MVFWAVVGAAWNVYFILCTTFVHSWVKRRRRRRQPNYFRIWQLELALGLTQTINDNDVRLLQDRRYSRPPLLLPTGNELPARQCIEISGEEGPELVRLPTDVPLMIPSLWAEWAVQHMQAAMQVPAVYLQSHGNLNEALARSQVEHFRQAVERRHGIRDMRGTDRGK